MSPALVSLRDTAPNGDGPLIYLHCGWPKTGTTSLQAAIAEHRGLLESKGLVYPARWNRKGDNSHNGITYQLRNALENGTRLDEITDFLIAHGKMDVLLSSESLTDWLRSDETSKALLDMIETMRQIAPVTVVWTLRRIDEMVHSLYVQLRLAGFAPQPAVAFMEGFPHRRLFVGMRMIDELLDGNAVYAKYDFNGAHNADLLTAFDIPADLAEKIIFHLGLSRPLNATRSYKQLVAVTAPEAVAERLGLELDRELLLEVFDRENFHFDVDGPCELAGGVARRQLHEAALRSAGECGFDPYTEFFADAEIDVPEARTLDPCDLSDADLNRLLTHLRNRLRQVRS